MTSIAERTAASRGIKWSRILLGAFLLEVVLLVVLVPVGLLFGMPGAGNGTDYRIFFLAVPLGCFCFGALFGRWTVRGVASQHALHGALLGMTAFLIYLAVCSIPPNSIAMVVAGYGAARFWLFNGLRLVGCVAGAMSARPR